MDGDSIPIEWVGFDAVVDQLRTRIGAVVGVAA